MSYEGGVTNHIVPAEWGFVPAASSMKLAEAKKGYSFFHPFTAKSLPLHTPWQGADISGVKAYKHGS